MVCRVLSIFLAILCSALKDFNGITAYFFSLPLSHYEEQESKTTKAQLGHIIFFYYFCSSWFYIVYG